MKIFNTFETEFITQCKFYTVYLPVEHVVALHKINFLDSLKLSPCYILRALFDLSGSGELSQLVASYNVSTQSLVLDSSGIINDYFANCVNAIT